MKKVWLLFLAGAFLLAACNRQEIVSSPEDIGSSSLSSPEVSAPWEAPLSDEVFFSPSLPYGRSFLEGEEADLYDRLLQAGEGLELGEEIPLPLGMDASRAMAIAYTVMEEHPPLYWARPSLEGGMLRLEADRSWEDIIAQQEAIRQQADALLGGLEDATPFEAALAIHDALAGVSYDHSRARPNGGNLYGALVEGTAYCNGYAAAFHYLAGEAGLESIYIRGESNRGVPHAWNSVQLDGAWHDLDVTWDRATSSLDEVYHDYFLLSRQEMSPEHIWDTAQYPLLPDTGGDGFASYYRRMGYELTGEPSREAFVQLFWEQLERLEGYPSASAPVFLECRVAPDADYLRWKELCLKDAFFILRELQAVAMEQNASFVVSDLESLKMDFNDFTRVITFYPYLEQLP